MERCLGRADPVTQKLKVVPLTIQDSFSKESIRDGEGKRCCLRYMEFREKKEEREKEERRERVKEGRMEGGKEGGTDISAHFSLACRTTLHVGIKTVGFVKNRWALALERSR